jgi:hypothetical protein
MALKPSPKDRPTSSSTFRRRQLDGWPKPGLLVGRERNRSGSSKRDTGVGEDAEVAKEHLRLREARSRGASTSFSARLLEVPAWGQESHRPAWWSSSAPGRVRHPRFPSRPAAYQPGWLLLTAVPVPQRQPQPPANGPPLTAHDFGQRALAARQSCARKLARPAARSVAHRSRRSYDGLLEPPQLLSSSTGTTRLSIRSVSSLSARHFWYRVFRLEGCRRAVMTYRGGRKSRSKRLDQKTLGNAAPPYGSREEDVAS